jgi:hypothetical protein
MPTPIRFSTRTPFKNAGAIAKASGSQSLEARVALRRSPLLEACLALGLLGGLGGAIETAGAADNHPPVNALPSQPGWIDPLTMLDGTPVKSRRDWEQKRRPELKALFQHYMYGAIPPKPDRVQFDVTATHADFLGGQATLKLVSVSFGDADAPKVDLMVVTPNGRRRPAPVFLAMNFCGNHAVTPDARVPLARGWLYNSCKGCTNNAATEAARGGQAKDWPLEEIIGRGFAFAAFCSSDVDSDRADVSDGIYAWLARRQTGSATNSPTHHRGSIAAWAWGYQRCVDYLVTDRDIDARRIAAVGHSRNGKTALLATAFDERIALAIPAQAGSGGTGPSRVSAALSAPQQNGRPIAETIAVINKNFPHWFNAEFKTFNDSPDRLPFDQHLLIALCAPRPVLLPNAVEDRWANPSQQFDLLLAAEPAYRLTGGGKVGVRRMPATGELVDSRLGYFIRPGTHSMGAEDWKAFLSYAETQWGKPRH